MPARKRSTASAPSRNLAAQTARMKKELRKGPRARRLRSTSEDSASTRRSWRTASRGTYAEFLSTQPFFEGSDMDDVAEEMFNHLKRVGVVRGRRGGVRRRAQARVSRRSASKRWFARRWTS